MSVSDQDQEAIRAFVADFLREPWPLDSQTLDVVRRSLRASAPRTALSAAGPTSDTPDIPAASQPDTARRESDADGLTRPARYSRTPGTATRMNSKHQESNQALSGN